MKFNEEIDKDAKLILFSRDFDKRLKLKQMDTTLYDRTGDERAKSPDFVRVSNYRIDMATKLRDMKASNKVFLRQRDQI